MVEPSGGSGPAKRAEDRDAAVLHDRRRPGRRDVDPALVPLLRGEGPRIADGPVPDEQPERAERDDLSASVGLARGLGIAGLVWLLLAVLIAY